MKHKYLIYAGLAALVTVSKPAIGDGIQSRESIKAAAVDFIEQVVQSGYGSVPVAIAGNLDSRLRLALCDEPLDAFQPDGGRSLGNTTVGVRCTGSQPWTLYVPVKVSIYEQVVVAAHALSKGRVIKKEDLKMIDRDLARLRSGYYLDLSQVVGKEVARTITLGAAITTPLIKDPRQVKRGQQIRLLAETSGLKVFMMGEALTDGTSGELIKVRNISTKRVINGIVISATTVKVDL